MGNKLSREDVDRSKEHDDVEAGLSKHIVPEEPPTTKRELKHEIADLTEQQQAAWKEWEGREYAIQPHTDAAGDAYCIGDAYEGIHCASEWEIQNPEPYLKYVKHLSQTLPHLAYLGHWMEVTAAPPKWKYLKHYPENRDARSKRTKACVIDYTNGQAEPPRPFTDTAKLKSDLETKPQGSEQAQIRMIIVEDLCRDLVEMLGARFDVDPLFFLSHISDYLFHNTRDPWVELPDLDVDARKRSHFSLQYLRARYFNNEEAFHKAEYESGTFNVLRRLDSDRSRKRFQKGLLDRPEASVTMTRAKTSLWIKPRKESDPVTAILLVDPTVTTGQPLWGGYRPFGNTPSMADWQNNPDRHVEAPTRTALYNDVIHWCSRLTQDDLDLVYRNEKTIAMPVYRLVIADWLTVLKYMTAMLGKIEWEFEKPHWGENPTDIDALLKKLSPWRRNVGYYQSMISEGLARLFPPEVRAPLHSLQNSNTSTVPSPMPPCPRPDDPGVLSLWTDFRNVKLQMDEIQTRIQSIHTMATNGINIEESRRAVGQNKNLARLTLLATIFIPLNFTSSFLSISPDFSSATQSIWLFFAIGIPLTLSALLVVWITHPKRKASCKKQWHSWFPKKESSPILPTTKEKPQKRTNRAMTTVPWIQRNPSSYLR